MKFGKDIAAKRLKQQVVWLYSVPENVKMGFPEIYGYVWTENQTWLYMKKMNMKTFSEAICNQELDDIKAIGILNKVLYWIQNNMYSIQIDSNKLCLESLFKQTLYRIEKINQMNSEKFFDLINEEKVFVNGDKIFGLRKIITLIQSQKQVLAQLTTKKALLLHGDLHTGNILFDDHQVKLLDPRGDFIDGGAHFDACYDSGKLLHDLHGKYSLIRNGYFDLEICGKLYDFRIIRNSSFYTYDSLLRNYIKWMEQEENIGADQMYIPKALLSEGLLLCGIVPFHIGFQNRALVLLISGLVLLNKWYLWSIKQLTIEELLLPLDITYMR